MAQLVARCVWDAEVPSSSLGTPTLLFHPHFFDPLSHLINQSAILPSMDTSKVLFQRAFVLMSTLLLALILLACSTLEEIGERPLSTQTFQAPRTATFGGRISVWMVSPTGPAGNTDAATRIANSGQIVGPVGTATAISQTLVAATETAAAPLDAPRFGTSDCPLPGGRSFGSPPDDFTEFPAAIGAYLSNGGSPLVLEGGLGAERAITSSGGVIQADTDLTGDDVAEIIVNIFNPFTYSADAVRNAGQLLVYGCDNGRYRLLYATPYSPGYALPVLHRVGDMNGDNRAELVFDIQSCSNTSCTREGFILSWNAITGVFEPLNNQPIIAENGRLGIVDVDSDGVLELTALSEPGANVSSGPTRSIVDTWDWTGRDYILATREESDARYRIHTLHDADNLLRRQSFASALDTYREVRNSEDLLPWPAVPNETPMLQAFATYRILTIYARLGDGRVGTTLRLLQNENPPGSAGEVYAALATTFVDAFQAAGGNVSAGCQAVIALANGRPEALSNLNAYGYANPSYTVVDLCPF